MTYARHAVTLPHIYVDISKQYLAALLITMKHISIGLKYHVIKYFFFIYFNLSKWRLIIIVDIYIISGHINFKSISYNAKNICIHH